MYKLVPVVKLKHFPTDSIRFINLLCRPVNGPLFFSPQNVKNYFSNYKIFPAKTVLNGKNYLRLGTQIHKLFQRPCSSSKEKYGSALAG